MSSDVGAPAASPFFVIDSEHLADVQSRLYGFAFQAGDSAEPWAITGDALPDANGAWVLVRRRSDGIEIRQDFVGSFGLYLYRDDAFFALSNSFVMLVDHVKRRRRLSLNLDVARTLIGSDVGLDYSETRAREIVLLDRSAVVSIAMPEGRLTLGSVDYGENTVDLDSPEAMDLLDGWYGRWTRRIGNLVRRGGPLVAALSGGFDTRAVLVTLLGAGIDLDEILIHSMEGEHHTFKEDCAIASQISRHYGFSLNNRKALKDPSETYSASEILDGSYLAKMGSNKQMYFKRFRRRRPRFALSGNGGECIRGYPENDALRYLQTVVHRSRSLPPQEKSDVVESITALFHRELERVSAKMERRGPPPSPRDLVTHFYRETRCRSHYGKTAAEGVSAGELFCCPLLDPELHRLATRSATCEDDRLLVAVLLTRYQSGLAAFPFEGGRSIAPATLDAAHAINARYPRPDRSPEVSIRSPPPAPATAPPRRGRRSDRGVPQAAIDAMVLEAFEAPSLRDLVEPVLGRGVFDHIAADVKTRAFFPLEGAHALLAIGLVASAVRRPDDDPARSPATFIAGLVAGSRGERPPSHVSDG